MTLIEMLRANGSWEADAAATALQVRDRRIEKLESALVDILKVPRSEASWGIALVIAHHALKED
jgi:hypothetical protein